MSNAKYPIHGCCRCGNVQYELLEPPLFDTSIIRPTMHIRVSEK